MRATHSCPHVNLKIMGIDFLVNLVVLRSSGINVVGTLKLGYPLLPYKDKEPTPLPPSRVVGVPYVGPSRSSPQARAATRDPRQHPAPPRGRPPGRHVARRGDVLQDIVSGSGLPWESVGPLYIQPRPPGTVRGSQSMRVGPLGWDQDPSERGSGRSQQGPGILGQKIPCPGSRSGMGPELTRVRALSFTHPLLAQVEA
jgi:hypothetical protein